MKKILTILLTAMIAIGCSNTIVIDEDELDNAIEYCWEFRLVKRKYRIMQDGTDRRVSIISDKYDTRCEMTEKQSEEYLTNLKNENEDYVTLEGGNKYRYVTTVSKRVIDEK
ncbi:MAG: hypothetical protein LBL58_04435 [Tannerellaceae bacterium]|jgi:uncharacterized protein YxeA|nr:hypothetical protein [Tannerellaceae bacterium]